MGEGEREKEEVREGGGKKQGKKKKQQQQQKKSQEGFGRFRHGDIEGRVWFSWSVANSHAR